MAGAENRANDAGMTPANERSVDPLREGVEQGLVSQPARPLTKEEREAAASDPGRGARVYAPESKRVPREPIPGDDELVHGDASDELDG